LTYTRLLNAEGLQLCVQSTRTKLTYGAWIHSSISDGPLLAATRALDTEDSEDAEDTEGVF